MHVTMTPMSRNHINDIVYKCLSPYTGVGLGSLLVSRLELPVTLNTCMHPVVDIEGRGVEKLGTVRAPKDIQADKHRPTRLPHSAPRHSQRRLIHPRRNSPSKGPLLALLMMVNTCMRFPGTWAQSMATPATKTARHRTISLVASTARELDREGKHICRWSSHRFAEQPLRTEDTELRAALHKRAKNRPCAPAVSASRLFTAKGSSWLGESRRLLENGSQSMDVK